MGGPRRLPPDLDERELAAIGSTVAGPVAVTGATGFIGSHVAEALLTARVEVRVLAREPRRLPEPLRGRVVTIRGDLADRRSLAALVDGAAAVVHLAGRVRAPSESAFDLANRAGTANLVGAVAQAGRARLVHVSSLAAAGPSAAPEGLEPGAPPRPVSAYGRSKLAAERVVAGSGLPWAILRPPIVYGPRDIDVLQFFRFAARGLVPLPAGERYATAAYVTDVVRAVAAALTGLADGRVLHLGEPRPWRLDDLVLTIAAAGGVRCRILRVPDSLVRAAGLAGNLLQRVGLRDVAMTSDKAREMLARHWTARTESSLAALALAGSVPLEEGAAATWRWCREMGWLPRAKITLA